MVRLDDFMDVLNAMCPECNKAVRDKLIGMLLGRREADLGAPEKLIQLRKSVAHECLMTEAMFLSRSNSPNSVHARRVFAISARKQGFSLPEIGRAMQRAHSSVRNLLTNPGLVEKNQ